MDYQELIKRLRQYPDDSVRNKAADAIEQLQAELAKYRDAPVVAWCHFDYEENTADYLQHFKDTYASIPLIVKPGELK